MGTPMTSAAVAAWMSWPASNALMQALILGHMSQQAKLDLRIVGCKQHALFIEQACVRARVVRDDSFADVASDFRANGNVLQVGLAGRQAARSRHRLVE